MFWRFRHGRRAVHDVGDAIATILIAGTSGTKEMAMTQRIQFDPDIHTGPCLKRGCNQTATYELIDPETERQRAMCPACGVYFATIDEVEDECDAE
jgi:hypothetical protein